MNRKKIILVLLFLIILTGLRFVWLHYFNIGHASFIHNGQAHLKEQGLEGEVLKLSGEWGFYPEQLITPEDINRKNVTVEKRYIQFPEQWFTYIQNQEFSYGTFHLQATIDDALIGQPLSIYIPRFPSASKLYINGELVGESGNPSTKLEGYSAQTLPYTVIFQTDSQELDVLIQVSHDYMPVNFSMHPLLFGTADKIDNVLHFNLLAKIIIMIFTLLLTIAAMFLFCMGYKTKQSFYFSLLMAAITLMVLFDPDGAALLSLPMDQAFRFKLTLFIYVLISIFLLKFAEYFLPDYAPKRLYKILPILYIIYGFLVITLPISIILEHLVILGIIQILSASLVAIQIFKANIDGAPNTFLLILAAIAVFHNVVWSFIKHRIDMLIEFYPLDILIALLLFAGYWICLFLQHVQDIEEKNTKLRLANKSKDDFLAHTSHEMRNPLHSMMHIAQYVLDNPENTITNRDRDELTLLIKVGKKMSLLINDLIDLSQIREHRLRLDQKAVHLHGQTQVVLDMLAHVVEGKPLQIINSVDPSFPVLEADENRLNQILLNLLDNAIKFTKVGTITIQAEVVNDYAVIKVADTGAGIEKGHLEKIFLPYEQVISEDNLHHAGRGLGLAITKELVELQGGSISVESDVGKGTTVCFTLPLFKGNSLALENTMVDKPLIHSVERAEGLQQLPDSRFKILMVDDERINLTVVSKILDKGQYEITFADNGEEALGHLNAQTFDLVISDVMMPMMSGFELARKIREHYNLSELPILLLTARARPEDIETGFLAGANDYVVKPVEPLELRARVRVLTDLKRAVTDRLSMEAAWLRAQINPHFIFNTINSIYSLMEMDQEKMRDLLDQFIYFLQTSFDFQNTNNLVSLEHEFNLVDAYLAIEKVRFGERIRIHKHIDVDPASVHVPPLLIQTLVENAVKHGILKRQEGGEITIEAVRLGKRCEITVKDNGVGLPKKIKESLRLKTKTDKTGIGLLNTEKRLQQYMGEGLRIESEIDKGTTIRFQLYYKGK
ncbi:ATP-binding protein [Oceanobacillus sp. J11TS1]|uniref:hybrid sensor histidine kinase/response regulator n=1 Tax=Oceanobacillus sp. J11TS1 TaxID=2807191 RepID=UPI001B06B9BE|nr:ATP-binding protein [Oceanobacillus sp. J11TS1]GIO24899.1 hypothetical protein J11TS1_34800 [Oceanobacillus sp. J11TS1]